MPVLKRPGPAQPGKRPERGGLAISAPLGDLRHTLHVGRGGDAFGDTSFLGRHGGGPPPETRPRPRLQPPPPETRPRPQPPPPETQPPPPADPLLTFQLDLGPSMLDAVLGVMDAGRPGAAAGPHAAPDPGPPRPPPRCRPRADLELDDVVGL